MIHTHICNKISRKRGHGFDKEIRVFTGELLEEGEEIGRNE